MAVKPVQSVINALTVLEHLAAHQPIGVTALARSTSLDKMAVQRILVTLEQQGWIRQVTEPRGAWELTGLAVRNGERQQLRRLASETGETALLFRREGHRMVMVDGVDSPQLIRMTVPLGTEAPLLQVGALDAFLDDAERSLLPEGPLPVSARRVAATRRAGSFVVDDMYPHAVAVGAPLFDTDERLVGSVIVVGPRERMPKATADRFAELVRQAARSIMAGRSNGATQSGATQSGT